MYPYMNLLHLFTALFFIFSLFVLGACRPRTPEETDAKMVAQEMEYRKIKRIRDPEVTEAAYEKGREIKIMIDSVWADSLPCGLSPESFGGLDSAGLISVEQVRLLCGENDALSEKEKMVYTAYLSGDGLKSDNVQRLTDKNLLLFTSPKKANEQTAVWSIILRKNDLVREKFYERVK